METALVIPARIGSTRLPRKPLIEIEGETVIRRTYKKCVKAFPEDDIYVATDSEEIYDHCATAGMQAVMTSKDCLTGTDRVAECAEQVKADYYINVQGDEPLMNPEDIRRVADAIDEWPGEIINGYAPIENESEYRSTSVPKVVVRPDGRLLYMSRSGIPGNKAGDFEKAWRQICVYGFPKDALLDFSAQSQKTPLESQEDIEILRFLELGYEVRMIPLSAESIAVDTPKDVEKVEQVLSQWTD